MILDEVKNMLNENSIPFEVQEFQDETEYYHHIALFPTIKNAEACKVDAIIIRSNNGMKNMELQFNLVHNSYEFRELWFGEYTNELAECSNEEIQNTLMDHILSIISGNEKFIVVNDLKHKRWLGSACFVPTDDDVFGIPGYEKALKKINKPKGWLDRLFNTKKQYEIYDWNTYSIR